MNVSISNVTLVENGMGVMPLIYGPPSLSHAYADKSVQVQVRGFILTLCFWTLVLGLHFPRVPLFPEFLDCWQQPELQLFRHFELQ